MENAFSHLDGKRIKLTLESDERLIVQDLDRDKTYVYWAVGDCCSHSSFRVLTGPRTGTLKSVVETEELDDTGDDTYDVTRVYTVTLDLGGKKTTKLVYQNVSNGYYGGYLEYR